MKKEMYFDDDAKQGLLKGVKQLSDAVAVTLGPKGRNVVISKKYSSPVITKDGVTVAKEVELTDPLENMGAKLLKEVSLKTADEAGDGTTTATILANEIATQGFKQLSMGGNPIGIKRGIDKAVEVVIKGLNDNCEQIGEDETRVRQIATISANNDTSIGDLITSAIKIVGKDGVVTVEEAKGMETELKTVEGLQFDRGFLSPYFINNTDKLSCELEKPYILIYDKKISLMKDLLPVLEKVVQAGRPLLIIAEDVDNEALATLVVNRLRAGLNVCAVKAPGFGDKRREMLKDISTITGGEIISDQLGHKLDKVVISQLGEADKVVITKDNCTIIDGAGAEDDIKARVEEIRAQIENSKSDYEKELMQERLAKLLGGVAIMYIGAASEVEMKEKKDRVDDALHATRAAIEEGIVPGGGVALLRMVQEVNKIETEDNDEKIGIQIVLKSLEAPIRKICENAGIEGSVVISELMKGDFNYGYNARTNTYENLLESGIIDPVKVTRVALQNAASVASMILTTECAIVDLPEEEKEMQQPQY